MKGTTMQGLGSPQFDVTTAAPDDRTVDGTDGSAEATVIGMLQRQVANAFALYVDYKRYHWYAYGPLFRELHLLFDDHADAVLASVDELAERVRILGGRPPATLAEIVRHATVIGSAQHSATVRAMIDQALASHDRVIAELFDGIGLAAEAGDPGTADLLTRLVQVHEKQEWFLRATAHRAVDGLAS